MFTKEYIQALLDQYITGSLNEADRNALHRIIRDPGYGELLGGLLDDALRERLAGSYHFPETAQRIKQGLLQKMEAEKESALAAHIIENPLKVHARPRWRHWLVAAAVTGAIIAGWQLMDRPVKQAEQSHLPAAAPTPVPGGNKASLVLADGSIVPLDSAGSQQIIQGHAAIQQQNGSLQYTADGRGGETAFNTLRTPRGGQFQVTLGDGTKVWLNSASSLRYPTIFNGKERVVELNGQAYFEIAAAASRPFKVKINGGTEVQVLGTQFDVMAYADEESVKTTLVQGAVRVLHKAAGKTLKPGQQAVTAAEGNGIAVSEADLTRVTAWKNGLFIFNNTELPAILREVSRWYDVDIVYEAPPSKSQYGGGISRKMALPDVLLFLEAGGANHFKIDGKKVIVLP